MQYELVKMAKHPISLEFSNCKRVAIVVILE